MAEEVKHEKVEVLFSFSGPESELVLERRLEVSARDGSTTWRYYLCEEMDDSSGKYFDRHIYEEKEALRLRTWLERIRDGES